MADRSFTQALDLRVTMAGPQATREEATPVWDRARQCWDARSAVRIGALELHCDSRLALYGLARWCDSLQPSLSYLPRESGLVGSRPPQAFPSRIAVGIDTPTAAGALGATFEAGGYPVLRGVIGPLTLDVRDQNAFTSIADGLSRGLEAVRTVLKTASSMPRAAQHGPLRHPPRRVVTAPRPRPGAGLEQGRR